MKAHIRTVCWGKIRFFKNSVVCLFVFCVPLTFSYRLSFLSLYPLTTALFVFVPYGTILFVHTAFSSRFNCNSEG